MVHLSGAAERKFRVSESADIHRELVQTYYSAWDSVYSDSPVPDFPIQMEITVELRIKERPPSGGDTDE